MRDTLEQWLSRYGEEAPRALLERKAIRYRPWPKIAALISDPSERASRLRQSTPIAGVLSARERERCFRQGVRLLSAGERAVSRCRRFLPVGTVRGEPYAGLVQDR